MTRSRDLFLFCLLLVVALVVTYWPVLLSPQTVNPDFQRVLAFFNQVKSLGHYLELLWNFQTVDVQPLRDLTVWMDLRIYSLWQLNVSVAQNLLWWLATLLVVERILREVVPELKASARYTLVLCFALYPAFSTPLVWGLARKHLLSFFFISLATLYVLKKRPGVSVVFYLLSLLSHPINLLFPLWAVARLWKDDRKKAKLMAGLALPLMLVILWINVRYYESSIIFRQFYEAKSAGVSTWDRFLALGQYAFNLTIPYSLTHLYGLGNPRQYFGLLIVIGFAILCYRKRLLLWPVFALLPLVLVSSMPIILSDTYLLTPGLALLVVVAGLRFPLKVTWVLVPVWVVFNFHYAKTWTNLPDFVTHGFRVEESCDSVLTAARVELEENGSMHDDVREYFMRHDCIRYENQPAESIRKLLRLQALWAYYSGEWQTLKSLSERFAYGRLLWAASLAQGENRAQVEEVMKGIKREDLLPSGVKEYDRVVETELHPYCAREKLEHCLSITKDMSERVPRPWL